MSVYIPENFTTVNSSCIKAVAYENFDLYVKFTSGSIYVYKSVPAEIYDKFMAAESKGRFFNSYIAYNFNYDYLR